MLLASLLLPALGACSPGAVDLPEVNATGLVEQTCRRFLDDLPDTLADQPRREVSPEDALGVAWGDPAIVVTCGGPPPDDFGPTSSCTTVNGVDWYVPDEEIAEPGDEQGTVTIHSVKRDVTVAVELPGDYWPPATALADLSGTVADDIPATSRCR